MAKTPLSREEFERYNALLRRLFGSIDWDAAYKALDAQTYVYYDISSFVQHFSHLQLDENYALFFYLTNEYHGAYGHTAAIQKEESPLPTVKDSGSLFRTHMGTIMELPEAAVPCMDALYRDTTREGLWDAFFFFHLLNTLARPERFTKSIFFERPTALDDYDEIYLDTQDWTPAVIGNNRIRIYSEIADFQSVFGETVYLLEYSFVDRRLHDLYYETRRNGEKYIPQQGRYNKERLCCVMDKSSALAVATSE